MRDPMPVTMMANASNEAKAMKVSTTRIKSF